jgi:hypothetical protein
MTILLVSPHALHPVAVIQVPHSSPTPKNRDGDNPNHGSVYKETSLVLISCVAKSDIDRLLLKWTAVSEDLSKYTGCRRG